MIDYRGWSTRQIWGGPPTWQAVKGHTTISGETLGHVQALIDRIEAARAAS